MFPLSLTLKNRLFLNVVLGLQQNWTEGTENSHMQVSPAVIKGSISLRLFVKWCKVNSVNPLCGSSCSVTSEHPSPTSAQPPPYQPPPPKLAQLSQLMNWHVVITWSPKVALGSLSVLCSVGPASLRMTSVHHHSVTLGTFPGILCVPPVHPVLLTLALSWTQLISVVALLTVFGQIAYHCILILFLKSWLLTHHSDPHAVVKCCWSFGWFFLIHSTEILLPPDNLPGNWGWELL